MGYRLSVLREGWEADCCYWRRGGGWTISTQRGLGNCCVSKCYWLMEFSLDHANYFERFFDWRSVSLFFCQANEKPALKHWTVIVIENIPNSRFRSSTVKSCMCPLSQHVPVLNDTHALSLSTQISLFWNASTVDPNFIANVDTCHS